VKLNLKNILNTFKIMGEYLLPVKKITSKFSSIKSREDLQKFVQERSAHVTQTTLYGYLKTRIGTRYTAMIQDEKFSDSINIAKWNIYVASIADLTLYVFSYLINKKNLKKNEAEDVFNSIINNEIKNGLDEKISDVAKKDFSSRAKSANWQRLHLENPFYNSGMALYKWSPIAEELKVLDKEIVLNSIKLKWNIVENEFKEFTKNLYFD
tara:strand:+ start:335 stop:964 length:630 start_codon:yes stop_codon:yes gene_type:complete